MRLVTIIDDDFGVAEVIAAFLSASGFETSIATSGSDGIIMVNNTHPNAVVCDMRMPGLGGHEVTLVLKAQPATSHIPVVLMTGYCDEEFHGMGDAFFTKPVDFNRLVQTVEQLTA